MAPNCRTVVLVALAGLAACSDDATSPDVMVDGVEYTASVAAIQSTNSAGMPSLVNFSVVVKLENITSLEVTRTYPSGCPVRVRLYLGGRLSYDETKKACGTETPTTITIASGTTRTLSSGARLPASVLGDSLAPGTYQVRAVVMTEGARLVELPAGSFRLDPNRDN